MKPSTTKNIFSLMLGCSILISGVKAQAVTLQQTLIQPPKPVSGTSLVTPSPLKKNTLVFNGKTYLLPDYLKVIKSEDGKFSIDKGDSLSVDHRVGNGGDYLRGQFLALGHQIILFLQETEVGRNLVLSKQLNVDSLKSSLDINKLTVVNDLLIDNSGSVVDAIGVPDLIIINSDSWMDHFERERNIYYLVFHEMLRSAAVNDDNYVISQLLMNFPSSLKVRTQLVPSLPLIEQDSLSKILSRGNLKTAGTGCPIATNRLYTELNLNQNTLDLTFYDYVTKLNSAAPWDRKNCSLSLPITLPKNKKLVVSLIDIQGQIESATPNSTNTAKISFEAFLAGTSQKIQVKDLSLKEGKKSFLMRKTNLLSSTCGGESILRLNSNILLTKGSPTIGAKPAEPDLVQIKKIRVFLSVEDCTL